MTERRYNRAVRNTHRWIVNVLVLASFAIIGMYAVDEPQNNFRFAVIGDRTGGAQPQIYGRVWREVDLLHPDFVLNVGDTIEGREDDKAEEEWMAMRPIWARYSHYPLYFTPGNHDVWSDFSRQVYEKETGNKSHYSFDYQDAHFVVLDTAIPGTLDEGQLAFLEQDLEANQGKEPTMVVFHHPFWLRGFREEGDGFAFHRMMKKYGVDYVLSGHGHRFVRMVRDDIVYMEVGSSGGNITGGLRNGEGFKDGRFYHWVWADVRNGEVELTIKEIGGSMGAGRMFKSTDWDEDGPKFDTSDPAITYKPET